MSDTKNTDPNPYDGELPTDADLEPAEREAETEDEKDRAERHD